jgi:CrcB protein
MANALWIGLGAVLGANARYFVSLWLTAKLGSAFPYGTLTVNAAGSLLLGFLVAAGSHYLALSPQLRLLLFVGFLGSFTTFSTFALDSAALWQNGRIWAGLVNILANNGLCLLCAALGMLLAGQFHRP